VAGLGFGRESRVRIVQRVENESLHAGRQNRVFDCVELERHRQTALGAVGEGFCMPASLHAAPDGPEKSARAGLSFRIAVGEGGRPAVFHPRPSRARESGLYWDRGPRFSRRLLRQGLGQAA